MENATFNQQIKAAVNKAIEPEKIDWELEVPKDKTHGDLATNIAMRLASSLKKAPAVIAADLVAKLDADLEFKQLVAKIEVAGPGFINFYLNTDTSKGVIKKIINEAENFGKAELGAGKTMMVEFGDANTHKAFHVGHLRSAISGLGIVRLKEALGYEVIKANYYGDIGMHTAKCTWAFMHQEKPADFENMEPHARMAFIDSCYVYGSAQFKDNPEAEKEIKQLNIDIYNEADNESVKTYHLIKKYSDEHLEKVYQTLGIIFDKNYPESTIYKEAIKIINANKRSETNPNGLFVLSQGAWIFEGEKEGLNNWVFLTGEGNPTYSGKDLGLAAKKFADFPELDHSIITTSVEQTDYFKAVIRCIDITNPEHKGKTSHVPFGWLLMDNKKASSRTGGLVKGLDIIEEAYKLAEEKISVDKGYSEAERKQIIDAVALGGLKFMILSHEFHKNINYDPNTFISLEGFSGPYVLYSYTRAKSVLAKAGKEASELEDFAGVLDSEVEQDLLKYMARYPETLTSAGTQLAPHIIATYVYNLAVMFNKFYAECPIIDPANPKTEQARLKLTEAVSIVLKNGLNVLGITTVEKM